LKAIAGDAGDALAVCTGWGAREWWALRPGDGNLKTRTLGLVSSIAAGLALALPHRKIIAIDGDGAFLVNLCRSPSIALPRPPANATSPRGAPRQLPTLRPPWLSPQEPAISTRPGSRHHRNFAASLFR